MIGGSNWRAAGLYSVIAPGAIVALGCPRGLAGLPGGDISGPALVQPVLFLSPLALVVLAVRGGFVARRGGPRSMGV